MPENEPTRSVTPAGELTVEQPSTLTRDLSDTTALQADSPAGAIAAVAPPGYELLEKVGSGRMWGLLPCPGGRAGP